MTKIKKKVSIEEKFHQQFKEKDFKGWYLNWYHLTSFLIVVCLVGSAGASFKYYQYSLPTFYGSDIVAGALTILVSSLIWSFTDHVFKYWYTNKDWDYILPLLLMLISWNAYTDVIGAPEIATEILTKAAPTNLKEDGIKLEVAAIDSLKNILIHTYDWRGKVVDKLPKRGTKREWHDVAADWATMDQYNAEKNILLASLETNNSQFNTLLSDHNESLIRYKGNLKGFSIGLTIAFILMTGFRYNFASNVSADFKPDSVKAKKKRKKKKPVLVNPSKQAEAAFKKERENFEVLKEEYRAMIENEKAQKKSF